MPSPFEALRSSPTGAPPAPRPDVPPGFATDHNAFAWSLHRALGSSSGNLVCSPFSVRSGLAMVLAGARGETATEISRALHLAADDEAMHRALGAVLRWLSAMQGGPCAIDSVNMLWAQRGVPPLPAYLGRLARDFDVGMGELDFFRDPGAAGAEINRWIDGRTHGRIRELVPADGLDLDTRLVLANAMFFRGAWYVPFDPENTSQQPFDLAGGGAVDVPLMCVETVTDYVRCDGFKMIDLWYEGGDLAMLLLLPDEPSGLGAVEQSLTADRLFQCLDRAKSTEVVVHLPRFKIAPAAIDLGKALLPMGMRSMFDRKSADFSGINGRCSPDPQALFVSVARHQAMVEVDEVGTVAAAATMFDIRLIASSGEPPIREIFRADHPFLFAIHARRSRTIFFIGRVADPTRPD